MKQKQEKGRQRYSASCTYGNHRHSVHDTVQYDSVNTQRQTQSVPSSFGPSAERAASTGHLLDTHNALLQYLGDRFRTCLGVWLTHLTLPQKPVATKSVVSQVRLLGTHSSSRLVTPQQCPAMRVGHTSNSRVEESHVGLTSLLGDPDSSGRETSGSPSPPPQSTSIFEAMKTSPCVKLRQLLRTIWTEHPPARNTIDSTLRGSMNSSGTLKRKAFEKCKNCDEAYDVDCNTMGACRYHPGKTPTGPHNSTPCMVYLRSSE